MDASKIPYDDFVAEVIEPGEKPDFVIVAGFFGPVRRIRGHGRLNRPDPREQNDQHGRHAEGKLRRGIPKAQPPTAGA